MALPVAAETSDLDLLAQYVGGSQAAFAELVSRYADLVYSAALRQVRDRHLAEDVTQAVFLLLSQKARKIGKGTILPAWLHRASRYCASNALRMRANRARHEQRAAEMKSESQDHSSDSRDESALSAIIDQAIGKLSTVDQQLVILRFFQGKSHQEAAGQCGLSPDAARKRIERALEKLRLIMQGLGVSTSAPMLAATLSSQSIRQTAPANLIKSVSSAAMSSTSLSIAKGALSMMFWTHVKVIALCTVAAVVLGAGITAAVVDSTPAKPEPKDAKTTLIQLAAAIRSGDADFVKDHIQATTPGQKRVVAAQAQVAASMAKFREAYGVAFGAGAAQQLPYLVGPANIPEGIQVTQTGDHAVAEYGMGKVELVRIEGVWKMDYSSLASVTLPMTEEQIADYYVAIAAAMDQITVSLPLGQYKSPADCMAALKKATIDAAKARVPAATQPA